MLTFRLNGAPAVIDADATTTTLLDYLRARGLTGAKEACAEGECGACTVAFVAPRETPSSSNADRGSAAGRGSDGETDTGCRSEYRAVNSCLILLPTVADHEVLTVESLATGEALADVQQAIAAAGGSQCGYCTPGFVMSLFAEQYRPDREGPCDPRALHGNLCRCTGYRPIRDAALAVGVPPAGDFLDRLGRSAPPIEAVDTPTFARPTTLAALLELLSADPTATLIAGGTDVAVECNLRGRFPRRLVSLDALDALRIFDDAADRVVIGAALPLAAIGRRWIDAPPAIREWLELFASPLIRNRATLGGNLATASPIGDAAPLLIALDASVNVADATGARCVPIASFFTGYRRTVLDGRGVIVSVEIPKPLPRLLRFYKVSKRRLDDISTVAAAMAIDLDAAGRVTRSRFGFGGVAATPVRLSAAESAVDGRRWDLDAVHRVQQAAAATFTPLSDHRGSAAYRRAMTASLVEKFWWETQETRA